MTKVTESQSQDSWRRGAEGPVRRMSSFFTPVSEQGAASSCWVSLGNSEGGSLPKNANALGPRKLSHLRLFPLLEDSPHPTIVCYRASVAWLPCLSLDLLWSIIPKTKSLMGSVEAFAATVLQLIFSLCQPCLLYFLTRTVPKTTPQWTSCM